MAFKGIGRYRLDITDTTTQYHKNRPVPPILKYRYITMRNTQGSQGCELKVAESVFFVKLKLELENKIPGLKLEES